MIWRIGCGYTVTLQLEKICRIRCQWILRVVYTAVSFTPEPSLYIQKIFCRKVSLKRIRKEVCASAVCALQQQKVNSVYQHSLMMKSCIILARLKTVGEKFWSRTCRQTEDCSIAATPRRTQWFAVQCQSEQRGQTETDVGDIRYIEDYHDFRISVSLTLISEVRF